MNKKLIFLASMGFLLVAPAVNHLAANQPVVQTAPKNDEEITKNVKLAINSDKDLAAFFITVRTDNGVVALAGVVPTERLKAALEAKAKAQLGVKNVVNKVEVKPTNAPTD